MPWHFPKIDHGLSDFDDDRSYGAVTPEWVARIIRMAQTRGWSPDEAGKVIRFHVNAISIGIVKEERL